MSASKVLVVVSVLLAVAGVVLGYFLPVWYRGVESRGGGVVGTSTLESYCTTPSSQDVDTDGDGIRDVDEVEKYGTNPSSRDTDSDGLSDYDEIFVYGTDPLKADTDGDGISDYDEVFAYKIDPLKTDTDGDGINDGDEVLRYGTDPLKRDTDGDGVDDYGEVFVYGTDPLKKDADGDGLSDYEEVFTYSTDPLKTDTDEDWIPDGDEVLKYGTDPLKRDTDGDGLPDFEEVFVYHTDPLRTDTDGDGLPDYEEIFVYGTDPLKRDSDGDGIWDGDEVFKYGTDPLKADSDGDEISDYEEIFKYGTDPLRTDTDGDGVDDYREIFVYHTDPLKADTDGDGIPDLDELKKYRTDPLKADTDGDGISDGDEVFEYGTDPLKPNPNVRYALDRGLESYLFLVKPLDGDGIQDRNEREFIDLLSDNKKILVIPTFVNYLNGKTSDGLITDEELRYSKNFSRLVNGLYDVVNRVGGVKDRIRTTDYSSDLGLRLGFDKEVAKDATVKAIAYYGVAVVDRRLPENLDEIYLLTRGTQIDGYGDKLVDFSPIVFHSVGGAHYVLTPDAVRETWMLAKHLKLIKDSGFDILKHPEMFEGLNVKIIANAYSIFDAPYGISYAERFINVRTLRPADKDVWDLVMLQWSLYSNKAPQLGGGGKLYNRDFPWYDSDKLGLLYKDTNTRRQALFFLFFLDNATFDMKQGKVIAGLEGARRALIQAEEHYNIVSSLYPDGKVRHEIWGDVPVWWFYYDWIEDRGVDRLENTHLQYVGLKPLELWKIMTEDPDNVWNRIKDLNGVDQFITKNWDYWHLMKFAMGYGRWNNVPGMHEIFTINYMIPQILRAFGFPTYFVRITPNPVGTAHYEWVVSLPDYVVEKLRSEFGDRIIIGPANGFGLYLCKEGLVKDGVKEILGFSGGSYLYRDRDGTIMVGHFLALNFKFYLLFIF